MYSHSPHTHLTSRRVNSLLLLSLLIATLFILSAGAALASFSTSPPSGTPTDAPTGQSTSAEQPNITCSTVSFATAQNYGANDSPVSVAVGDFDDDGRQDLVTANRFSNNVSILLGNSNGTFQAATNYNVGVGPFSVAVGDFDADGKQDLAVANNLPNNVSILLGNGDGTFGTATNFGLNGAVGPFSVAVGDFNANGKQDLAVTNQLTNDVSILLGNGDGTFGVATNFEVNGGDGPISVLVGDFNGDGKQDLATANSGSSNVSILLGNGNGTFQAAANFTVGTGPYLVSVGDFNGDGKRDLATANFGSANVSILLGNGNGTFQAAANFTVGDSPQSVAVGDFNADGKQDLATANKTASNVSILLGTGNGSFGAATNFGLNGGLNPYSVAVGDFNADGKQDLATATSDSDNVSILISNCTQVCQAGAFATSQTYSAGTTPYSVATGDFNADGKQDLATANSGSANVSILLGTGTGTFGVATNFGTGNTPQSVAVGDFNRDGKQDLAVANYNSNNVSILIGTGTGSFNAAVNYSALTGPFSIAVGDFNRDGKQDLVTANQGSNDVSILLGTGSGTFGAATTFDAGTSPYSVAVGDFNRDGKQDLAVANNLSANVSILLGNGNGTFQAAANFTVSTGPRSVAVGDFDGDGDQDLATANSTPNTVSILLGTGSGTFGAAVNYSVTTNPQSVAVGDFNGDSKQDLATANNGSANVSILLGNGNGTFAAPTTFGAGTSPKSVAVGDFNGDGTQDLVTANNGANNVSVLLGICVPVPTATPTRTSTSPPGATNTPTRTSTSGATPTCSPAGLTEGFESGTLGAFTNVVPTCVPGGCNWTSVASNPHSGTRSAFAPDGADISDQYLELTNGLTVANGSTLTFWHHYNTEFTYDGGVLEATTNNGSSWADMSPFFTSGGYNDTINLSFNSPIAGRPAWTGNSGSHVQTTVNLTPYAGQSLRIRFRLATDATQSAVGWNIDDISISTACGGTSTPTSTSTRTPTPPPGSTNTNTPTITPTSTRTDTPRPSPTITRTFTRTPTSPPGSTSTPTRTPTRTSTNTPTNTPTRTHTAGPSPTPCVIGGLTEGFESGTLGAFTNVVPTCVPGGCNWSSVASNPHTGTRSAFAPDGANISDQYLQQTAAIVPSAGSTLTFWHLYNTENTYDGGVLEATTNNGSSWQDMGPNITSGGYNGTIDGGFQSPIAGRQAWTGTNTSYSQVIVNLTPYAGQSLRIRFRLATDATQAAVGWNIDDISISGSACATNTPTVTPTNTPTNTPTRTPTQPAGATNTPNTNPTPCAISFTDVLPGSTFYDFIRCMACRGIINGYTTGCDIGTPCFKPNNNITRGQLSKIVANAANFTEPAGAQQFEDVLPGSTFYDFVWRLFSRGIVNGYPCGSPGEPCGSGNLPYFRPNANVTRAQLSKIVSEGAAFADPPGAQQFEDVPVGSTFYSWIWRLANRSVIGGYACGGAGEPCGPNNLPYFRPGNNATRGQASKIVSNTFFPGCVTPQQPHK